MDIVTSNFLPGDPRLIDQIVYELKSQGIFDQFRKECIADVDTKPAYQNLSQRVEGSVMNFLKKQKFSEDMNKNQLREQLRKNISESGFLETGVERIVDQVVNPKINTVFLPKVEDVVYRYLGIEKPNHGVKEEEKPDAVDLLPNDLEAISPESAHVLFSDHSFNSNTEKKDESMETNENSLNSSNTKTEDESPPFELLEENTKFSMHEENSVDSHLSGITGLASHESSHSTEIKDVNPLDISQDNSQNSVNSEGNLSIVTSEEDTKMEICEDSNLSENKEPKQENSTNKGSDEIIEDKIKEKEINVDDTDIKEKASEKIEEKTEVMKSRNEVKIEDKKIVEVKKSEDKKSNENKSDSKKSHEKHKSSRSDKNRKGDKDKRSRSKSESKSKDHKDSKSGSKHSSSSKEKDRDKDKKDYRNGKVKEEGSEKDKQVKREDKERDKSKDKSSKSQEKEKSEKDRDKAAKDKEKTDKDKTYKDKSVKDRSDKDKSEKDKEKSDRERNRSEKEKGKSDKDKDKVDKVDKDKLDKDSFEKEKHSSSKHSKEKAGSSKKDSSNKGKDKSDEKPSRDKSSSSKDKMSSSSKHKESSSKEKESSKNSKVKDRSKPGSSNSKDKDKERKGGGDSKSRSSDKHKKSDKDKSSQNDKNSSPIKKDKDKKAIDDHYSLKDKKSERRSTDRDSNDGSSKMSRNGSFTESYSQSFKGSSKESSEVFSSGSGDSSNSDKMEENLTENGENVDGVDAIKIEAPQTIKYIKPKFASNIHEAMKIMKIRKQLAKLERQNQLALAHVQVVKDSQGESRIEQNLKELSVVLEKSAGKFNLFNKLYGMNNEEKIKLSLEHSCDKEEQTTLSGEQPIKSEELGSPTNNNWSNTRENETQNTEELITEETPTLKSQDLSMECFEALEARLAQEMSNVNCHMYGEEDDSYEYASISFSPVKKRKISEEQKPSLKKILFDTTNTNAGDDEEIELVVNKQFKMATEESCAIQNDVNKPVSDFHVEDHCDETIISKQIEVASEETEVLMHVNSNIVIENGEELVIDEVHEEYVDYIQETIINDAFDNENGNLIVENKNEILEQLVGCTQETVVQENVYEKCDEEMKKVKLDNDHQEHFETRENGLKFYESDEEFRGFDDVDKDNSKVITLAQKISEMRKTIEDKLTNIDKPCAKNNNISVISKMGKDKIYFPINEERIILKHGLSLEATIKEVKNMSSTIQDLLQKNGKKLFIKIDKLEYELPSKILVSLQGVDIKENVCNQACGVKMGYDEEVKMRQVIQEKFKEECMTENKECESQACKEEKLKRDQIFKESSNASDIVYLTKSNNNGLIEQKDLTRNDIRWEDDDSPCYFFDKSDSKNEKHLKILTDVIGKLEKAVEKRSLQIQNNIPVAKKRGRKRKAQSTENNNSFSAQYKPASKKRDLSNSLSKQNGENVCNTSFTLILDVSSNQNFSLPLSPADSDKSDEHKKEEPVTVKTKRTGRVANSKRYCSDDLYKPRPVLSCTRTRRRSAKVEEHKS